MSVQAVVSETPSADTIEVLTINGPRKRVLLANSTLSIISYDDTAVFYNDEVVLN